MPAINTTWNLTTIWSKTTIRATVTGIRNNHRIMLQTPYGIDWIYPNEWQKGIENGTIQPIA